MPSEQPAAVPLEDSRSRGFRTSRAERNGEKTSLISLLRQLPSQLTRLIRDELRAMQIEFAEKAKSAGLGAGLLAGAAFLGFFAFAAIITSAILALALVLAAWLSALIVAVVLLAIGAVLGFLGQKKLKQGMPPVPTESLESVKADIRSVKGVVR